MDLLIHFHEAALEQRDLTLVDPQLLSELLPSSFLCALTKVILFHIGLPPCSCDGCVSLYLSVIYYYMIPCTKNQVGNRNFFAISHFFFLHRQIDFFGVPCLVINDRLTLFLSDVELLVEHPTGTLL